MLSNKNTILHAAFISCKISHLTYHINACPILPILARFLGSLEEFFLWLQRFDWSEDNIGGNFEKVTLSLGSSLQHFLKVHLVNTYQEVTFLTPTYSPDY